MFSMNCPNWRSARCGGWASHGDRRESFDRAAVTGLTSFSTRRGAAAADWAYPAFALVDRESRLSQTVD